MTAKTSKQPTAGDDALLLLYNARNLARRALGVGLIKPALDSTDDLLDTIRESTADRPEYIGLEQSCVGVREILDRGAYRRPEDHLSQSGLEAIEELIAIVDKAKRNIVKQGKRRAISRALHSKDHKEAVVSWRLSLNKILCTLSSEFGSDEPTSTPDPRHEAAEPRTAAPDVHPGDSSAGTVSQTASYDIPDSRTAAPQVPTEAVKIHAPDQETHSNATESIDAGRNPGCSTHVSVTDRPMPPVRDSCRMTPDVRPHVEKMRPIVDTHEMINGMPQWINRDTGDRPQLAAESISGESPPPPQRIFGREELVKNIVDLVDTDYPTSIALTGTGGIGKTSVALAVLHDDRIKQRFGDRRRLLRCDQFSASLLNFLRRLSEVIGAGIPNPADLTSLRPALSRKRLLLIIDNAESIFGGPAAKDIGPVVEELSQFGNIWLCITSRTSNIPTRKVIDVPTLSMDAARETFQNIYRRGEQPGAADEILKQLDFHPLSITLLATAAKSNRWGMEKLEKEWEERGTDVLRARQHASLAATIEVSLHSPMFLDLGPHARDLLGVVAFFPQGVDENNLDWLFPSIADRRNIFDHFCVLSLTHRNEGFITMLAPLRDHFRPEDPTSASLLCLAKECYFSRLSFSIEAIERNVLETRWITSEDVNVEHLLDVLTSANANSEAVWDACGHFMYHLFLEKPRIPVFGPKIGGLPDDYPPKPRCLSGLSSLWSAIGNPAEQQRLLCHTLKLYRERGDDAGTAGTLGELSPVSYLLGLHEEAIQQAREAMGIYQRLGSITGVVSCHIYLIVSFRGVNKYDDADECETRVIELINTIMPTADPGLRTFLHKSLAVIYTHKGDIEKTIFHDEAHLGSTTARVHQFTALCVLVRARILERRFDDAEAHLEHARLLATNGSSELGELMYVRALLLFARGKFEEARSEALRAIDFAEEVGGESKVERAKKLLQAIDKLMVERASMGEFQASVAHWSQPQMVHAALGGDISQDEKASKAATKLMASPEKDGDRSGGPNFFQIRKVKNELAVPMGPSNNKEVNKKIAGSRAIPTAADNPDNTPLPEPVMRQDKEPVVIWTTDPKLAHVGQLWQALYHVPQVRHRISQYRSPHPPEGDTKADPSSDGAGGHVFSAHEVFRHMELSGLAVITVELSMERFPNRPWEDIFPCEDVEEAYTEISEQVEISLNDGLAKRHPDWPRLFHSRINDGTSQGRSAFDARKDFSLISLVYNNGDEPSDLIGCLTNQVFSELPEQGSLGANYTTAGGRATVEPADVIAFALARDESPPSPAAGRSQQQRKFSFPKSFHLGQFATTSCSHIQNAKVAEGETLRKTGSDRAGAGNKGFMKSILSSLYYYENVARSPTDAERHAAIESSAAKLKSVIAHIDAEWNAIGTTAEELEKESHNSSSSGQAQKNKYDLRAVLMHDGQKGREHVYSYINHEGAWWKVVGCTVTKVAFETVLSDENGMEVGAGPFFLIYSRSLSEPPQK